MEQASEHTAAVTALATAEAAPSVAVGGFRVLPGLEPGAAVSPPDTSRRFP